MSMIINVVNRYKHTPTKNDFYVGRGSVLGNPYTGSKNIENTKAEYQVSSREEAIEEYKKYLTDKIKNRDLVICQQLNKIYLKAKTEDIFLVCYCSPQACHADIIKEIINEKLKNNS